MPGSLPHIGYRAIRLKLIQIAGVGGWRRWGMIGMQGRVQRPAFPSELPRSSFRVRLAQLMVVLKQAELKVAEDVWKLALERLLCVLQNLVYFGSKLLPERNRQFLAQVIFVACEFAQGVYALVPYFFQKRMLVDYPCVNDIASLRKYMRRLGKCMRLGKRTYTATAYPPPGLLGRGAPAASFRF